MKLLSALLATALAFAGSASVALADTCYSCGRIQKIEQVKENRSGTAGAVTGAVVGGVVGNQVGGGDGKKLATVAGAVAGAYAGKKIAEDSEKTVYKITVQHDDGRVRTYKQGSAKGLRVGDPVRVKDGKVKIRS